MQLNAKRKRKYYRTELEYIRAVYQHNKKKIIRNMDPLVIEAHNNSPYQAFKDLVTDLMSYTNPKTKKKNKDKGITGQDEKFTAREAIKRISRSKYLNKEWTTADIYARNFHSLVTKDKALKEKFYEHEGIKKIELSLYEFKGYYTKNGHSYVVYHYGDSYFLEPQSPKEEVGGLKYYTKKDFDKELAKNQLVFDKYRKRKY